MNKERANRNLTIRIPTELAGKFREICHLNYKTMSEAVRDLIQQYIKNKGVINEKN